MYCSIDYSSQSSDSIYDLVLEGNDKYFFCEFPSKMAIEKLPDEVSRRIKSQQYIHDTYIITKELIENALDANASKIKIQIDSKIRVDDNGKGIENITNLGINGYTSKGEHTYMMLGIPENKMMAGTNAMDITNRKMAGTNAMDINNEGFQHGFRGQALASIAELCELEVMSSARTDGSGHYKNVSTGKTNGIAREQGTTVIVSNLFKDCAIRRQLDSKNKRKSINALLKLLKAFCYVYSVEFQMFYNKKLIFCEHGCANFREKAISNFGDVFLEVNDEQFAFLLFPLDRSEEQYLFTEKRMVKNARIQSLINTVFKRFFDSSPTFILLFKTMNDTNISVDKSEIILQDFRAIEGKIKMEMDYYFGQKIYIHGSGHGKENARNEGANDIKDGAIRSGAVGSNSNIDANGNCVGMNLDLDLDLDVESKKLKLNGQAPSNDKVKDQSSKMDMKILEEFRLSNSQEAVNMFSSVLTSEPSECLPKNSDSAVLLPKNSDSAVLLPSDTRELQTHHINNTQIYESSCNGNPQSPEAPRSAYDYMSYLKMSHGNLAIDKSDFCKMQIIGQFNQGFILCILKKKEGQFLAMIDQHAADEIYNFEKLQDSFYLKKQELFSPVPLSLTPIQELLIEDNISHILKNGFVVKGSKLLTVPVYKGHFFGVDDFYSLLKNLENGIFESDRFREIMASKACRTSIMIGKPLKLSEMKKVVSNLGTLRLPWKCPHGRSTFQILMSIQ